MKKIKTKISIDLVDPVLIRFLKIEAQETGETIKEVLIKAIRSYFSHRLETKALMKAAESVFEEWNDPRDSEYNKK